MGKRSNFDRIPKDLYRTIDPKAVEPLLPYLDPRTTFDEPCCGHGDLINHLESAGHICTWAGDIDPQGEWSASGSLNALDLAQCNGDCFITNPPWDRKILHPLIAHLSAIAPCWLLFDGDWAHTKQAVPYLPWCQKIVSVGRVKWIKDSPHTGKDNCAWYRFDRNRTDEGTLFFGRTA